MPLISAPDSGVRMPTFPSARVIPATVPKEDREAVARGAMSRIASTARVDSARTIPFPRVEDIVRYQAEPGGIESDD